ncbi:hypothetical protein [Colwellia sp. MEBiC06753]
MEASYQYSLALALFDFVPVILSSLALILIFKLISTLAEPLSRLALAGVVLIILGGSAKVTWKFLVAAFDIDIILLNNSLFIFMAPGFTLLTHAFWLARRNLHQLSSPINSQPIRPASIWLLPISIIALFSLTATYLSLEFPTKKYWFFLLLLQVTLANIVFIWHCARYAWLNNNTMAMGLFILNLLGTFMMSYLGRLSNSSEAGQWIAEITNTFTQGALLLGAWLIYKKANRQLNCSKDINV